MRYWVTLAFIYFAINTCCLAANDKSASAPTPSVKLKGKVDIVFSSCSAAGITLSSSNLPASIDKVRLGSPAFYANLAAGDKVLSAQLNNNSLALLIERHGQKFSTQLATHPVDQNVDISNETAAKETKMLPSKTPITGSVVYTRLADALIKQFSQPEDKQLQSEVDLLQRQTQVQVESNGGQWHIAAYYRDKHGDPRFLLCEGVRFYAIGDWQDAQRIFEQVAKLYPENADAYFNLGALCESKSEFALAASYYKQALKQKPFDLEIQKAVATVGQVPLIYQGGAFELAASMKALRASGVQVTDTCDLCKILRNGAMHGG
jgi:tetratricopeptide (TPR) repeat protein